LTIHNIENRGNIKVTEKNNKQKFLIRQMQIDDLAAVFHLGEKLFTLKKYPTLYRTWMNMK